MKREKQTPPAQSVSLLPWGLKLRKEIYNIPNSTEAALGSGMPRAETLSFPKDVLAGAGLGGRGAFTVSHRQPPDRLLPILEMRKLKLGPVADLPGDTARR